MRELKKGHILAKDTVRIKWTGKGYTLAQFVIPLKAHLLEC